MGNIVSAPLSNQKERVLLNGRNFFWASEVTGQSQRDLEVLYLEAKFKGVLCSVEKL